MNNLHRYTINNNNNDNNNNILHCSQTRKTAMRARKRENYRAIAGGITTIMLIALAVVAGGAAAAVFASQSSASKGGVRAVIEDIKLVRSPTTSTFSVVVKNVGIETISSATISIPDLAGATANLANVAPGQTKSGSVNTAEAAGPPGTVYTATATYTGASGSTASDIINVTVEGI